MEMNPSIGIPNSSFIRIILFSEGKIIQVLLGNDVINEKNFRKLRMTVDQLELKLREQGV